MMKKIILGLVVLVAIVGIGFAAFNNNTKTNDTNNNSTVQVVSQNTAQNTSNNNTNTGNMISSEEAKKIATKYIDSPGATAGTPKLVKQDNKYVYIVPVMDKGQNVGEIDIDAITGANLGGAGGS